MKNIKIFITKIRLITSLGKLLSASCKVAFITAFMVRFLGYMKLSTALYIIVASALINKIVVTLVNKSNSSLVDKLREELKYDSLQQVSFDLNAGKSVIFENVKDIGVLELDEDNNLILKSNLAQQITLLNSDELDRIPEILETLKKETKSTFFRGQLFFEALGNKKQTERRDPQ